MKADAPEMDSETLLLLSTDESGRIPFPEGAHCEIAPFLQALCRLHQRGCIEYRLSRGCIACYLTDEGRKRKSQAADKPAIEFRLLLPRSIVLRGLAGRIGLSLFVGTLLAMAAPLYARLGESPVRLEARYGAPVKYQNGSCTRDFQCTYHHGGMTIVVDFLDEKSQCESYSNEDGSALKSEEIQALMSINSRGGKWNLKEDSKNLKRWNLSSGDVVARQDDQNGHTFELRSSWWQHFLDQRPTKTNGEANERLKDF